MFLLITRMAAWLWLSRREEAGKTTAILILRHQLAVLQPKPRRPKLNWADRALTATLLRVLPKAQRQRCGCLSPRTRSCADICAWCCRSTPPTTTADGPTARLTFRHP